MSSHTVTAILSIILSAIKFIRCAYSAKAKCKIAPSKAKVRVDRPTKHMHNPVKTCSKIDYDTDYKISL